MELTDCKNEQQFKKFWIAENFSKYAAIFPVETEETIQGFPDVLAVTKEGKAVFFEFKYGRGKSSVLHFQPTQPAFYKKHKDLDIRVVASLSDLSGYIEFTTAEYFKCARSDASISLEDIVAYQHYEMTTEGLE